MTKIKFKITYKPLSTEKVNAHKNFDALMGMYVAAPKLNFFQKLFQNKWTMFTSGIITGGLIATLIVVNTGDKNVQLAQTNSNETTTITQTIPDNQSTALNNDNSTFLPSGNVVEPEILNTPNNLASTNTNKLNVGSENENISPVGLPEVESDVKFNTQPLASNNTGKNTDLDDNDKQVSDNSTFTNPISVFTPTKQKEMQETNAVAPVKAQPISYSNSTLTLEQITHPAYGIEVAINDLDKNNSTKNNSPLKSTGSDNNATQTATAGNKVDSKTTTSDSSNVAVALNDMSELAEKIGKKANNLFVQITKQDKSAVPQDNTNSTGTNIQLEEPATPITTTSEFIDRYAQFSFFTPISSNGIDGYKYYHHISINAIQGFNGAVEGLEVGGVFNGDKGYVIGGQFAGVGNVIGGNLTGAQGAGVFNVSKSTLGLQAAGVANYNNMGFTGLQAAGVANYSGGAFTGMQAAGVVNIASGFRHDAKLFQAAGVVNIALSKNLIGMQASGVVNLANNITGAQIGLVNIAKKVNGAQIGLINIADTINGASIGLLSFSRNGIFDVDVFTSDIFTANVAVRLGTPYVYNTFAFGVNPGKDSIQYGYGFGIGGHIPIFEKLSVDIDGMAWSTLNNNFEYVYQYFHMFNQFRVMPAYAFNNWISIYGGPVFNVEIYDKDLSPIRENTFANFNAPNVVTGLSMGYVLGLRFF